MKYKNPPIKESARLLDLAYYGNPVLRKKARAIEEITEEHRILVDDMVRTMYENHGWGIAAPQVGLSIRLFVTGIPDETDDGFIYSEPKVYINPVLTGPSNEVWFAPEGCLSLPDVERGEVERPVGIHVRATNLDGEEFEEILEGWPARYVMHENDHLNGVLYPDRMMVNDRKRLTASMQKLKKQQKSK